jgi:hypothetical protein
MAGSTIDHLVSVTVLLAALLLFISLFNQTIQTAIVYQIHESLATKASDLLDNMMLSTGSPTNWGASNITPSSFGLQDPEFTQYMLSPFSLMRLQSSSGQPVYYFKTGLYYSNITMGFGGARDFLLVSSSKAVNYSTASRLLGINGSYGFQLTIMPLITVSVSEIQAASPLKIAVNVTGAGLPLTRASVSYSFLKVSLTGSYPSYTIRYGSNYTNTTTGSVLFTFPEVTNATIPYSFIAYARFSGLVGVGYHQRASSQNQYVIPFINDLTTVGGRVLIAHSYDVHNYGSPAPVAYNATFILLTQDFTEREMPLNATQKIGIVNYGNPCNVTIPTYNSGILVITYKVGTGTQGGVVLMPWGLSSMAFPVIFGGNPFSNEWVATDIRQVVVGGVAYQAKLGLWRLQGYGVIG